MAPGKTITESQPISRTAGQGQTPTYQLLQEGSTFGSKIKLGKNATSTAGNEINGIPQSMSAKQGASKFASDIEGDESAKVKEGNTMSVAGGEDESAK
ncbi:hypothetical protein BP5796_03052 [Coleophoma crateriformis]|uniref:Uncharacterized protein n=1 Tax=Coleophoma crateriformis TaxID=565419 RepID=A0A3D8SNH9_9HELO|nr:hypothetical protein BP5796_03052 [Coleophoma crateriformis]